MAQNEIGAKAVAKEGVDSLPFVWEFIQNLPKIVDYSDITWVILGTVVVIVGVRVFILEWIRKVTPTWVKPLIKTLISIVLIITALLGLTPKNYTQYKNISNLVESLLQYAGFCIIIVFSIVLTFHLSNKVFCYLKRRFSRRKLNKSTEKNDDTLKALIEKLEAKTPYIIRLQVNSGTEKKYFGKIFKKTI